MTKMQISMTKASKEPVYIDDARVFYHKNGGFKHDWVAWEVEIDGEHRGVRVIWPNYSVFLTGKDAYDFLTIVKCKFAEQFRSNKN